MITLEQFKLGDIIEWPENGEIKSGKIIGKIDEEGKEFLYVQVDKDNCKKVVAIGNVSSN